MCVPRTNPATQDDPECPKGNRPLDPVTGAPLKKFTMAALATPGALTNPMKQAPLMVGDFITYSGIQGTDARGPYLSSATSTRGSGSRPRPERCRPMLPRVRRSALGPAGVSRYAVDFKLGILIEDSPRIRLGRSMCMRSTSTPARVVKRCGSGYRVPGSYQPALQVRNRSVATSCP